MKCHGYVNGCMCPTCRRRARSYNTRGVARKEVRQFIDSYLTPHGWTRVENDSAGHLRFWHPEQEVTNRYLTVSQTPSDFRWRMNTLRSARRLWPKQPLAQQTRRTKTPSAPVVRITPRTRADRLCEYATMLGVRLTREQAVAVLERERTLAASRTFLDRVVEAKRRQGDAA